MSIHQVATFDPTIEDSYGERHDFYDFEVGVSLCFLCAEPLEEGQMLMWAGAHGHRGMAFLWLHYACVPHMCQALIRDWNENG
tara:strand:- start:53 stop:301 length:249 start_codon:yes stop_codon:yes gene_type:complete